MNPLVALVLGALAIFIGASGRAEAVIEAIRRGKS